MTATTNQNRAAAFNVVLATESKFNRLVNTAVLMFVSPQGIESTVHATDRFSVYTNLRSELEPARKSSISAAENSGGKVRLCGAIKRGIFVAVPGIWTM